MLYVLYITKAVNVYIYTYISKYIYMLYVFYITNIYILSYYYVIIKHFYLFNFSKYVTKSLTYSYHVHKIDFKTLS